ncbi:hypothetical protein SAMD00019534_123260 [Acytostelium subglobosum LB1]|uniref:hypothetical protein n=1 Tax=Acytostelium subglobosum LB1 TaxID=1410327 RepID=UPI000644F125|nr:hypothetical protein SAMD00019534_123260 [Acytostelium subglobosum LB1]GAM29150.1 hypothetical protein SAMD00019534_123260 [Acytostelium subglobosum LB1]|eukprot:XP_012747841.1 hypothetical protein SAMD00019534_123260 [Acytostelium subglobosum LB1]
MSMDKKCQATDTNPLSSALQYLPVPDDNLTINIVQIGCVGLRAGETCDSTCLEVSNRWITNVDFASSDNRNQAKIRCPLRIGACDYKAMYSAQEMSPHSVCRYPEIKGILLKVGAGMGLLNGTLITLRLLIRAWWNRIGTRGETPGTINDYWRGLLVGLIFNYFGIAYLTAASAINKRFRYGGQLAIGFLIMFFKYWTPMSILLIFGCIGVSILTRTTYNLLDLEIQSRNCVVMSQDLDHFNNLNSEKIDRDDDQFTYIPPDKVKPVLFSQWRHFFLGFAMNIFAIYPLAKHDIKRYSGLKAGFYFSICTVTLVAVWIVLYSLDAWQYITFNFPFPLGQASRSDHHHHTTHNSTTSSSSEPSSEDSQSIPLSEVYRTAFLQSTYFAISWSMIMVIVYHFSLFIKYLPETRPWFSFVGLARKPQGKKTDYNLGVLLSTLPMAFAYFCFFYFEFTPYVNGPLPKSPADCTYPGWTLVIPPLGVIPAIGFFIFAHTELFRWGALSSIGVNLMVFCLGSSALLFNYCLGSIQEPNAIYVLDKKNHDGQYIEEERLLQNKPQHPINVYSDK